MRMERVNEHLKREIGDIILKEIQDPRLSFITIVSVETSRDLRQAKVYYSFLGKKEQLNSVKAGLERARGFIRKLIGQRLTIRYTPELVFIYDQSIEYGDRIEQALKEIHGSQSDRKGN